MDEDEFHNLTVSTSLLLLVCIGLALGSIWFAPLWWGCVFVAGLATPLVVRWYLHMFKLM